MELRLIRQAGIIGYLSLKLVVIFVIVVIVAYFSLKCFRTFVHRDIFFNAVVNNCKVR